MKKLLFTVSISLIALFSDAQSFASNDAEWVYNYPGGFSYGITKVKFSKDTILGNRNVKVFTKEAIRLNNGSDTSQYFLGPIYLHLSNGTVEYSLDKINFDTLINFNAKLDQAWTIYRYNSKGVSDSLMITVLDTFRLDISNNSIFCQKIKWTYLQNRSEYSYIDTVQEHIGFKGTYIFPFDAHDLAFDGGEGGVIRCFKNDKLGIVSFSNDRRNIFEYDCDNLSNVGDGKPLKYGFSLYPNPASEHITFSIVLDKSSQIRLELNNSLGKQVHTLINQRYEFGQHSERLLISHLPIGIYYCKLYEGDKIVGLKRFIKL